MKKLVRIVSVVFLLFFSLAIHAQESATTMERPKVGLVLSGGGAKGAAHIGVLKYIEEAGIPIDYIAGTSMGSIVGGMLCIGVLVFRDSRHHQPCGLDVRTRLFKKHYLTAMFNYVSLGCYF